MRSFKTRITVIVEFSSMYFIRTPLAYGHFGEKFFDFFLNTHILHYDTTMNRSGCLVKYAHKIGDFGAFTESAV